MKRTIIATAVILLTVFSAQANAELTLTANDNSFNFDPENINGGTNLIVEGSNGLSDLAVYVGYQTGDFGSETTEILQLVSGDASTTADNFGQFDFDSVTFSNGVTVDGLIDFRLSDVNNLPDGVEGPQSTLLYDLSLTTTGVNAGTEGSLQSFVGFDFNGDAGDSFQAAQTIPGFGTGEITIGAPGRLLAGDFTFNEGEGGATADTDNTNIDAFSGLIGADLDARFDGVVQSSPGTGDLGFGAFSNFDGRAGDQTDTTAGVVLFRSAAATSTIPEPSTLLMASMGLGMVAFRRRRKQLA